MSTTIFPGPVRSLVTIFDLATRTTEVIYEAPGIIEAPNWSKDDTHLLVNTNGDLFRLRLDQPKKAARQQLERVKLASLSTEGATIYRCNNDHDYSPDGTQIAFSATIDAGLATSQVFTCNSDGSNVQLITEAGPSYFHGWSSDGGHLAFVAGRRGPYEICEIPSAGGDETQLTTAGGYDDGPDYSPDGMWIYFNSQRSGHWHLYRMPTTGGGYGDEAVQQLTDDGLQDWFPHVSPDGHRLVWISFPSDVDNHDHRMPGMRLRMADLNAERVPGAMLRAETLLEFPGGQGSLNVNSWSADSNKFAFVQFMPL